MQTPGRNCPINNILLRTGQAIIIASASSPDVI